MSVRNMNSETCLYLLLQISSNIFLRVWFENRRPVGINDNNMLGESNLIFCYTGPTNPKFWQIKKIIPISHIF